MQARGLIMKEVVGVSLDTPICEIARIDCVSKPGDLAARVKQETSGNLIEYTQGITPWGDGCPR